MSSPAEPSEERNARRPNPVDSHVGSRVKMRRMMLGMSQERLGELLGLTFQQVQKYEKGVNRIGASRLFDLAHVLGVPIQYFYDELPAALARSAANGAVGFAEDGPETFVTDIMSSRDGIELTRAFAKITDPNVRRSVVDLVKAIASGDVKR
ncbi:MAG: helix-turn-helix domain-containing protein [Hyphomicrobiaceae bacterium]